MKVRIAYCGLQDPSRWDMFELFTAFHTLNWIPSYTCQTDAHSHYFSRWSWKFKGYLKIHDRLKCLLLADGSTGPWPVEVADCRADLWQ